MDGHAELPYGVRADLFAQLAQMESAGLPALKAFELLKLQGPAQARVVAARRLLARGGDPAFAGERSGLFTRLEARLVKAALNAGSPASTYRRLAAHHATRAAQLAAMRSRMMLPGFMLVAALFIAPLPQLAAGTLGAGRYLWHIVSTLLAVAGLAYAIAALPRWVRSRSDDPSADAALLRIPLFGPMRARRNARDFFASLALLLEAGVSMLDALPAAIDTIENRSLREQFRSIAARIEDGATFAQALAGLDYPGSEQAEGFVRTGEASGTLPEMLARHAELETATLDRFAQRAAEWAPRIAYALVAGWIAYGLLSGPGVMPVVPKDL